MLTVDPPAVANAYHYTDNNPLNNTDPSGLRTSSDDVFLARNNLIHEDDPGLKRFIGSCADKDDVRACLFAIAILERADTDWTSFGFKIRTKYGLNCQRGVVGYAGENILCANLVAMKEAWWGDPPEEGFHSETYSSVFPTIREQFGWVVLHEFAHMEIRRQYPVGEDGRYPALPGSPGFEHKQDWCDLIIPDTDGSIENAVCVEAQIEGDRFYGSTGTGIQELLADCRAQSLDSSLPGPYWFHWTAKALRGCPNPGVSLIEGLV